MPRPQITSVGRGSLTPWPLATCGLKGAEMTGVATVLAGGVGSAPTTGFVVVSGALLVLIAVVLVVAEDVMAGVVLE